MTGDWRDDALCAESLNDAAFFPEMGASAKYAQRICAACPVRQQCLEYALDNEIPWGIWGGVTASDRRAMREPVKATYTRLDYDLLAALIGQGLSDFDVSVRVGCSRESVARWRKRNGVLPNVYRRTA